jgi:hypothetical protein
MMAELVRALHARRFRQLVLEWPHMVDWLLADFVHDGQLEPEWRPSVFLGGNMITAIRDFNRSLPEAEHIDVRAIDVNLEDYGGASEFHKALEALSHHLPSPGPVGAFLQASYATHMRQAKQLATLRDELEAQRSDLVATWGAYWYETVSEMVEVERASVPVRAMRKDHYDLSVRLRENVIKRLADLRLEAYGHGTVINIGSNHAQKEYLTGTSQEWFGDYLVHKSRAAAGSVIVLGVTPARVVSGSGGATTNYDIMATSPENELFRLMYETWSDQIVFLPLDDPVFRSERVPLNFEGTIYVCAPERHYDVLVVLPLAHRVPFT